MFAAGDRVTHNDLPLIGTVREVLADRLRVALDPPATTVVLDLHDRWTSTPITVMALAAFVLGRKPQTGADFAEAGLPILGGCEICGASVAAYNSAPSRSGLIRCVNGCVGDDGFADVIEAYRALYPEHLLTPDQACEHLRVGRTVRKDFARGSCAVELYVNDGMVMCRAVKGWAEGTIEPMCGIDRPFLTESLSRDGQVLTLVGEDVDAAA